VRRHRQKLAGIAWFVFVFALMGGMFSASYFLLAFVYQAVHWHPANWLAQVIASLFGLLLTGLLVGGAGKIARGLGWMPERNVFSPIIEALEKIARGDFDIRVSNEFEDNEMVGKLATSVNAMAEELSQMEKMRQEFISNVSHEIQSPLTSIRGFAQALKNDRLSPEQREHYLSIIEDESTRLSRITENLLRLAALEADRVKFEPVTYRLDRQIRSLILVCEPQWSEKGIDMDISMAEIQITADEDLLSQVWLNLIHNSIKFTNPGGRVSVCLRQQGDRIEFEIADNGPGISETDQEHIFERFFKADPARTRSNEGSGLGLSIARKIVEMHHGTIGVHSQVDAGTTFTVILPV
jgi:two-component system, OmpR family, phosphate regulon sensor histidine kinase PhoR